LAPVIHTFASALMLHGPSLWLVSCLSACCTSNES